LDAALLYQGLYKVLTDNKLKLVATLRTTTDSLYKENHGFALIEYNESRNAIEQYIYNSLDPKIEQFCSKENIEQLRQEFITNQFKTLQTNNQVKQYIYGHEIEKDFQLYLQKKFTESVLHSEEILNNPKIKEHIA
jgi:hypothetical protein